VAFITASGVFVAMMVFFTAVLLVAERYLLNYGDVKININDGVRIIETSGGDSLLSTLNGQSIFIPSACGGHGTCGFCKT
jgi:Na+-transporting NADH:ubiquinone oxidoreductase subunit F